ncbi:hypothetical protein MTR_6g047440 [Medicago truncatula]|uniref:Uncharacterized protein n=1 Tax=Medicago truncatula TaxID=3880 RepID=A0A072U8T1_MEDTR|nr:hypothetical protein MTR_6g047440 [Medicago truncatula]
MMNTSSMRGKLIKTTIVLSKDMKYLEIHILSLLKTILPPVSEWPWNNSHRRYSRNHKLQVTLMPKIQPTSSKSDLNKNRQSNPSLARMLAKQTLSETNFMVMQFLLSHLATCHFYPRQRFSNDEGKLACSWYLVKGDWAKRRSQDFQDKLGFSDLRGNI